MKQYHELVATQMNLARLSLGVYHRNRELRMHAFEHDLNMLYCSDIEELIE